MKFEECGNDVAQLRREVAVYADFEATHANKLRNMGIESHEDVFNPAPRMLYVGGNVCRKMTAFIPATTVNCNSINGSVLSDWALQWAISFNCACVGESLSFCLVLRVFGA